jgi:predicted nucleic acid-binding protein
MAVAYLDTSIAAAVAFHEAGWSADRRRLASFDAVVASDLLVAEFAAAVARERLTFDAAVLAEVRLQFPSRSLGPEIDRVLRHGYLPGAACWHLATALYIAPEPAQLSFLTRDARQRAVAKALGFRT